MGRVKIGTYGIGWIYGLYCLYLSNWHIQLDSLFKMTKEKSLHSMLIFAFFLLFSANSHTRHFCFEDNFYLNSRSYMCIF